MKRFLDKGFYFEGLRQTKMIAIVFTCIMGLWAIFYPLSIMVADYTENAIIILSAEAFNPLFLLCFILYVPFMGLSLFSFLNKRNSSDFYHSLPHRRETIYASYVLSILTWVLVTLTFCSVAEVVLSLFGVSRIQLEFTSICPYIFNVFAGSVFVLGAGMIAMSLTGTLFSNIITSLLIIFLPRVIMVLTMATLNNMTNVIPKALFGSLETLIPFSSLQTIVTSDIADNLTENALYCLSIGIIYLILGGFVFCARKSETAGYSAVNGKVQAVIRVSLSLILALMTCSTFMSKESPITTIMMFCMTLISYFTYEVISTKKLPNIRRFLPGISVLVALCLIFIAGLSVARHKILSVEWTGQSIDTIVFEDGVNPYDIDSITYQEIFLGEIEFEEPELKGKIAQILQRNQEQEKESSVEDDISYATYYIDLPVKVTDINGKVYKRRMWMTHKEYEEIQAVMRQKEAYRNLITTLPEEPLNLNAHIEGTSFITEELTELYEIFREEVKELSDTVVYSWFDGGYTYPEEDFKDLYYYRIMFAIEGRYQYQDYSNIYTLNKLTPKTAAYLYQMLNEVNLQKKQEDWTRFQENKGVLDDDELLSISFSIYEGTTNKWGNTWNFGAYENTDYAAIEALIDVCDKQIMQGDTSFDYTKPYCVVTFEQRVDEYYGGETEAFAVEIPETLYEELPKIVMEG